MLTKSYVATAPEQSYGLASARGGEGKFAMSPPIASLVGMWKHMVHIHGLELDGVRVIVMRRRNGPMWEYKLLKMPIAEVWHAEVN